MHPLAIREVVHECQKRRQAFSRPGEAPVKLCFRPTDGRFLTSLALDTLWMGTGHDPPDLSTLVVVALQSYVSPVLGGQYVGRPTVDDVAELGLVDVRELAAWYHRAEDGQCWRAGSTWPPPVVDELAAAEALSAVVKRKVMRALNQRIDTLPAAILGDAGPLIFDPLTGECFGGHYPVDPHWLGCPQDHFIRVRLRSDDPGELAVIEAQLDSLRLTESGQVLVPAPA